MIIIYLIKILISSLFELKKKNWFLKIFLQGFILFSGRFIQMKNCPGTYYVTVIEDLDTNRIIGAASLIVEYKFIHNCGSVNININ